MIINFKSILIFLSDICIHDDDDDDDDDDYYYYCDGVKVRMSAGFPKNKEVPRLQGSSVPGFSVPGF